MFAAAGGEIAVAIDKVASEANGPAWAVERNSTTGLLAQLLALAPYPRGRLTFAEGGH